MPGKFTMKRLIDRVLNTGKPLFCKSIGWGQESKIGTIKTYWKDRKMVQSNPIFKKNYVDYLKKLDTIDFSLLSSILDIKVNAELRTAQIPFFQADYQVSASGVVDHNGKRPSYDTCVILLKYLLMCPRQVPGENDWVNFRDLKSSGYTQHASLADYAIQSIARHYAGNLSRLKKTIEALNGKRPETNYPYDVSDVIAVLPRIPILFLFNDVDGQFPARAFILFEQRAEQFLDAECLAMVGSSLFGHLKRAESDNF